MRCGQGIREDKTCMNSNLYQLLLMQIIQKERAFATRDCDRYGLTGRQSR